MESSATNEPATKPGVITTFTSPKAEIVDVTPSIMRDTTYELSPFECYRILELHPYAPDIKLDGFRSSGNPWTISMDCHAFIRDTKVKTFLFPLRNLPNDLFIEKEILFGEWKDAPYNTQHECYVLCPHTYYRFQKYQIRAKKG